MKNTSYISFVLFLSFICPSYSQSNKILIINGTESHTDEIIQQIGYKKNITHDSLYIQEVKRFRNKLDQLGFIHHTIDSISINDSIYYIRFNLQNSIKKIIIKHPDLALIATATNYSIKKGMVYIEIPFSEFSVFMGRLSEYFQNNGHPFVDIKLIDIKKTKNSLTGELLIDKKRQRTIDKIILKGYTSFPKVFINRKFNLTIGDLYNKKIIRKISKECISIDFVSEIKSPELLFAKDSTYLYLYLKKERSNYFDGLVGFSNSKNKKGIQLYGTFDLKVKNALNTGERVELKWRSNQSKAQTLDLSINTPYIYRSAFSIYYKLNIHKQDSLFSSISNLFGIEYSMKKNQDIGFIIERLQSNRLSISGLSNIKDFNSFFYGSSYTYRRFNNHTIFTNKIFINSQISQGVRNGLTQYKFSNRLHYLFTLNNKNIILLKNTTEILISKNYIENELFRIGGSSSIRGFEDYSIQSTGYTSLNAEYNYIVGLPSFLSGLIDLGVVNNKLNNSTNYLYSFGIGFSQKTKMGQLSVQYFIGNLVKDHFSLTNSKIHISLSQKF